MATNPIGKGTQTIGINMSKKMANELEKRASSMHISKSKYCKIVLQQWIDSSELTIGEKETIAGRLYLETPESSFNERAPFHVNPGVEHEPKG